MRELCSTSCQETHCWVHGLAEELHPAPSQAVSPVPLQLHRNPAVQTAKTFCSLSRAWDCLTDPGPLEALREAFARALAAATYTTVRCTAGDQTDVVILCIRT